MIMVLTTGASFCMTDYLIIRMIFKTIIIVLALTRKICGILSKKLQKLALLKLLSNSSVKATVFCYFFDIPQILQV